MDNRQQHIIVEPVVCGILPLKLLSWLIAIIYMAFWGTLAFFFTFVHPEYFSFNWFIVWQIAASLFLVYGLIRNSATNLHYFQYAMLAVILFNIVCVIFLSIVSITMPNFWIEALERLHTHTPKMEHRDFRRRSVRFLGLATLAFFINVICACIVRMYYRFLAQYYPEVPTGPIRINQNYPQSNRTIFK